MSAKIPGLYQQFKHINNEVEDALYRWQNYLTLNNRQFAAAVWGLTDIPTADYSSTFDGKGYFVVIEEHQPTGIRRARFDNPAHLCCRSHAWVQALGAQIISRLVNLMDDEKERDYCLLELHGEASFDESGAQIEHNRVQEIKHEIEEAKRRAADVLAGNVPILPTMPTAKDAKRAEVEAELAAKRTPPVSAVETFFQEAVA